MGSTVRRTSASTARFLGFVVLLGCIVLLALRFVALAADFPGGISTSGDLYTDEGWYASAALSAALTGRWYTPGDFNPAINMPAFPLLQSVAFTLAGPSLVAARGTVALSFVLLAVLATRLLWRVYGAGTALLALLLLATNFMLFAYSRFAITEIPMIGLVLAALLLLSRDAPRPWQVCGAASLVSLAVLMKTTAMFAVPVVGFLVLTARVSTRRKVAYGAIIAAGLLGAGAYHALARAWFPTDYVYFNTRNIADRVSLDGLDLVRNALFAAWGGRIIDPWVYVPTLAVAPLVWRALRASRIALTLGVWVVSYGGLLSLLSYNPERYYLALAVPVLLLCAIVTSTLWQRSGTRWARAALATYVALVVGLNVASIARYLGAPRYSYLDMARDIERRIAASEKPNGILMGDIASTISLATGQPSINARWGTQPVAWKLARYAPAFLVTLGQDEEVEAVVEAGHDLELLAVYDVFGNYYDGARVHFYAIEPPAPDG
jgi:4-amino-4-deoxy-L-arabinose transferase-like glycosyltransferase